MTTDGRHSPRAIKGDAAHDGYVLTTVSGVSTWMPTSGVAATLVDAKGDLIIGTANDTVARQAVGANGTALVADSAQTTGAKWETRIKSVVAGSGVAVDNTDPINPILSVAGAGGTPNKDVRWQAPSSQTSIDEFNDSSLNASWARVDAGGGTGRATWTEDGDSLSVSLAGGDATAELHAMVRPLTSAGGSMVAGDAFVTHLEAYAAATNFVVAGLVLADGNTYGAGNQVAGGYTINVLSGEIRAMTNYSTQSAATTVLGLRIQKIYFRLVMVAANSWRVDVSPDGISWMLGSAVAKTVTPTHVGFFASSWGTSTKGQISFDMLRRMSGV